MINEEYCGAPIPEDIEGFCEDFALDYPAPFTQEMPAFKKKMKHGKVSKHLPIYVMNKKMTEFNLSEKMCCEEHHANPKLFHRKDVKEFIKRRDDEDKDWVSDIISLIDICNYEKDDLIAKMKRLCKAHIEEKQKLAGDDLI